MKSFSFKEGFNLGTIVFAVAAIIALPLRTLQYFGVLEGQTGFFTKTDFSVYLLYFILIGVSAFCVIYGLIKTRKLDFYREAEKRPVYGVFSLVAAAGAFIDGITCATSFMNDPVPLKETTYLGEVVINTSKLIYGGNAILAVISAIFFLAIGLSAVSGKTNGSEHKIISLAPVIWTVLRLVHRLTRTISFLRVSELTFELFMLVFMLMFFMAFAQINSQISCKKCEWKIAGYGIPAALFALVCFVPRLIVTLIGQADMIYSYSSLEICDLTNALFIVATVFMRTSEKSPEQIARDIEEEKAEKEKAKAKKLKKKSESAITKES